MEQPANINDLEIKNLELSIKDKKNEAKKIINHFLLGQSHKRSFGVRESRFIAPHQYLMAKQFLENN